MHKNVHDSSDVGAMRGPTVEVKGGSDGVSVEVGHEHGATALTAQEWRALEAKRSRQPRRDPHLDPPIPAWALEAAPVVNDETEGSQQ